MPDEKFFKELQLRNKYRSKILPDEALLSPRRICSAEGFVSTYDVETVIMNRLAYVPIEWWDSLYHRLIHAERKFETAYDPIINDYIDDFGHLEIFKRMIALASLGDRGVDYIPDIILDLPLVRAILCCFNRDLESRFQVSVDYPY